TLPPAKRGWRRIWRARRARGSRACPRRCRGIRIARRSAKRLRQHLMAFSSWRGVVGMINPTMRLGVTEEVIRLLPEGIGLIPLFLDIRRGVRDEFETVMPAYERNVALLAEQACDLINPVGAPPFMVLGRKAETRLVAGWEKKYKTTIFTVAQNHVAALTALKVKTIVGATYFSGEINDVFAKYFEDAGFTVRGMAGIEVPFDKVQELSG